MISCQSRRMATGRDVRSSMQHRFFSNPETAAAAIEHLRSLARCGAGAAADDSPATTGAEINLLLSLVKAASIIEAPAGPETVPAESGASYPPLRDLTQPAVPTAQAAHYLNRRPQTLRGWACTETWPEGLRPVRINGRLAWPVAGIKAVLGV